MNDDRNTVGVTAEGQECLDQIMETGWFRREMDAYRLAVAVGIGNGLPEDETSSRFDTKWNVGTIDRDGMLAALIQALLPDEVRPYARAERLAAVGLRFLRGRLIDDHASLEDLMSPRVAAE